MEHGSKRPRQNRSTVDTLKCECRGHVRSQGNNNSSSKLVKKYLTMNASMKNIKKVSPRKATQWSTSKTFFGELWSLDCEVPKRVPTKEAKSYLFSSILYTTTTTSSRSQNATAPDAHGRRHSWAHEALPISLQKKKKASLPCF